jgi:exonuclease SbcC
MRVHSVTAHAFGALVDETLALAEGMTVIVGENESGKSTWHAATYAAICGTRRSRGQPRREERRFAEMHQPWDNDGWMVSARIELDDGRCIELRNDLAGRVECSATDLTLGTDVSGEIMNEGAPDAALWLGLDRTSFAATACIPQSEVLQVIERANGLQECLQRAAATAGTDATAAAAIERIVAFARDRVGLDRANSNKPLRRALNYVNSSKVELDRRRKAHDEYLDRLLHVDSLHARAQVAVGRVLLAEAVQAETEADRLEAQAEKAAALLAQHPGGAPETATDEDELGQRAQLALVTWTQRPEACKLPSRTTRTIQDELDSLPDEPNGDQEMHPSVRAAVSSLDALIRQLDLHDQTRPAGPTKPPAVAAGDQELLDLAIIIEAPSPVVPDDLAKAEQVTRQGAEQASSQSGTKILLPAGAVALVLGVLIAIALSLAAGVAISLLGILLAAIGLVVGRGQDPLAAALTHAQAEGRLRIAQEHVDEVAERRRQALDRCQQLGLAADPQVLRNIPSLRYQALSSLSDFQHWSEQRADLRAQIDAATTVLQSALSARSASPGRGSADEALAAARTYGDDCAARCTEAARARRRVPLEAELLVAEQAELRLAADEAARSEAVDLVVAVAAECSLPSGGPEEAAEGLTRWLENRSARLADLGKSQQEWADLNALLDGHELADLQRVAAMARRRAAEARTKVRPDVSERFDAARIDQTLAQRREEARAAEQVAAGADGELRQVAEGLLDVAEAEEELATAEVELDRVHTLDATLGKTREFLEQAQTRVHRSMAPVLAAALKERLPAATGGRYIDAIVDTSTLRVQVCGPGRAWRDADRLSYGTAEQVYLLLRVALAERLTDGRDTCPLLLDDVTVHADRVRSREMLSLLLQVAETRQVILFTQEELVASWARETLDSPRHAVRELDRLPIT